MVQGPDVVARGARITTSGDPADLPVPGLHAMRHRAALRARIRVPPGNTHHLGQPQPALLAELVIGREVAFGVRTPGGGGAFLHVCVFLEAQRGLAGS